jgi:hypothetical protein
MVIFIFKGKVLPGLFILLRGSISTSSSDIKINVGDALCEHEVLNDELSPFTFISIIPSLLFFIDNVNFYCHLLD